MLKDAFGDECWSGARIANGLSGSKLAEAQATTNRQQGRRWLLTANNPQRSNSQSTLLL
jgi:hypothetical protein